MEFLYLKVTHKLKSLWQMSLKDLKEFHNSTVEGSDWRKIKPFTVCTSLSYHSSISWIYLLLNDCFRMFACQMEMSFLCIDLLSKGWISHLILIASLSYEGRQCWERKKKIPWDKITVRYRHLSCWNDFLQLTESHEKVAITNWLKLNLIVLHSMG